MTMMCAMLADAGEKWMKSIYFCCILKVLILKWWQNVFGVLSWGGDQQAQLKTVYVAILHNEMLLRCHAVVL